MKKKTWYFLLLIITLLMSINIIIPLNDFFADLSLINDAYHVLQKKYVEPDKLEDKKITYEAIRGMVKTLDEHTVFMDPEQKKIFFSDLEGSFGGVGIQIDKRDNYIVVVSAIEGTPAYQKGIRAGDKIVEVDGESVVGISIDGIMRKLRGEIGTEVKIGIMREGVEEIIDFNIKRAKIEIPSVTAHFMLNDDTGYIRLSQFNETAFDQTLESLKELESKGMKKIVFDLRDNPGGLLEMAYKISNLFIENGKSIVSTKGRDNKLLEEKIADSNTPFKDVEIAVLINDGTASASEIFSGAIKDLKRGILIGQKSYGKGSVQKIYPLSDESSIKVTVAYYFTPSGKCVDKKGIEPDYEVVKKEMSYQMLELVKRDYFSKFAEKYHKNYEIGENFEINPNPYPDFINFLEKESNFDFKDNFIKDEHIRELLANNVENWKNLMLTKIKKELSQRLNYKLITLIKNEMEGRKYLSQNDRYIDKAESILAGGKE
ncbi:MAG: S41 family peptidase [Candidatus Mcinerneyibacterium aminivorans]|uniref:S41 family peptidase n=1 Tax=Candidatus Mcinerneyibacterium aminivorans TaxID=2703815 RepID=A0A5D0M9J8_9BACT|nr:MAG: S41 family peptidase [Candidatus Mcinerneyibacterium aminivorans]